MRAIKLGGTIKIYDDSVETYVQLPPATYSVCYSDREGCYLEMHSDIVVSEKTYGVHSEKVKKVMCCLMNLTKPFERIIALMNRHRC